MEKSTSEILTGLNNEQVKEAFKQVYGEPEQVEEVSDKPKVVENKSKVKTIELDPTIRFQFEFAQTVDENSGEIQYKNFDFKEVFQGMDKAFEVISNEWSKLKNEAHKYSKEFINKERDSMFLQVLELKSRFEARYKNEIKQLKTPNKVQKVMSYSDEQINEMRRANNLKMMEHFLKTCNIKQLSDLYHYQNNKSVYDVVIMLLTGLDFRFKKEKNENVKREINKLQHIIHKDLAGRANPDYFQNLDMISNSLDLIFRQEKFPIGLENGMTKITYVPVLPR